MELSLQTLQEHCGNGDTWREHISGEGRLPGKRIVPGPGTLPSEGITSRGGHYQVRG